MHFLYLYFLSICVCTVHSSLSLGVKALDELIEEELPMEKLPRDRCTAIASGPLASTDGSSFTSQTVDCADCDFRINKVRIYIFYELKNNNSNLYIVCNF